MTNEKTCRIISLDAIFGCSLPKGVYVSLPSPQGQLKLGQEAGEKPIKPTGG